MAHQRALLAMAAARPHPPDRRASPTEERAPPSPPRVAHEGGFGPLRFREVGGEPVEAPAPPPLGGGGGGLRAADMTAERMKSIVSAIESGASGS